MDKAKLVWNVFRENINSRQIEIHNVFDHYSFRESLKKLFKAKLTKEEFAEQLRREISYYYWTKVEWEITIASYPTYIDRAEFERLIEEGLNKINIGPGGLTGVKSVMGVNVEQAARHPSCLAVGVSVGCWAHRRACIKVNADLTYEMISHKGVEL